jgi:hypothetical protein
MEIISGKKVSLREILNSSWGDFCELHGSQIRPVVTESVSKVLRCGTDALGFALYRCECGHEKKVSFTCKNRFCSSCGKPACDMWMKKVLGWSLPDMRYRHIVFTLPQELRLFLMAQRRDGLDILFRAAKDTLLYAFGKKYGAVPGIISVVHTFGGDIKWNPHVHCIVTEGGLSPGGKSWKWGNSGFLPFRFLNASWKYHVVSYLREWGKGVAGGASREYRGFNGFLDGLYRKKWYVNVGEVLESLEFTVRYIGRYAKRPVLAETRLEGFDGKEVSFSFTDKRLKKKSVLVLPVLEFIGKLVRHIPEKGHRMIRYGGIFANRVKGVTLPIVNRVLSSGKIREVEENIPASWRERLVRFFGFDPLLCPVCGKVLELCSLSFRKKDGGLAVINFSP